MADGRREDRGTRLGSWKGLIPLTVAAAAALCIGGGVDMVHRHQQGGGDDEREAKPAAKAEQTDPRFVVGVTAGGAALVVRDVHTGADVGLPVAPPEGRRFQRVAAVKDDGSFIVASYGDRKVTFQRLQLDDDGAPQDLKDVPEAVVPGASTAWSDIAVTEDHIAYVTYAGKRSRVDVLTLSSGARKTWTTKSPGRVDSLSWSGTTLSFVWTPVGSAKHQLRTIDTSGAAGDLKLSKAVMTLPKGSSHAVLTRNGKQAVVGTVAKAQLTVQTFALTGEPAKILWRQKVTGPLTGLDIAHTGGGVLAAAGDLYTKDVPAVPGKDLADATW
ncbi:hypothetical protein [Actinomadura chokoriensis]|uniref:hypothetical protein n=1 Tax=Actinomadura chokoriensis TaxID=454156 RepID=UPI0031F81DF2